jgi:hypothetical protein
MLLSPCKGSAATPASGAIPHPRCFGLARSSAAAGALTYAMHGRPTDPL